MTYKMTNFRSHLALLLGVILFGASCGSPKRYAYLQNVEIAKLYDVEHENKILVRPGDRLRVVVQSAYPELVRPFNGGGYANIVRTVTSPLSGAAATNPNDNTYARTEVYGYEVDREGQINFPVLGYIKVQGLNREGVAKLIEAKLREGKHIPDPKVDVMYANFKIYLLGAAVRSSASQTEVNNYSSSTYASTFTPITSIGGGVLRISDRDELNILEALSYLGEMPMNANIEKVNVIRRVNGQFVTYRLNLKSTDIFQSPGFYLKQDDIVYIEQLYRRSENEAIDRVLQYSGYILTSLTSVLTTLLLLRRY